MKRMNQRLTDLLIRQKEAFFFFGLSIWEAIGLNWDKNSGSWSDFIRTLAVTAGLTLPAIIFSVFRQALTDNLSRTQYLFAWAGCFAVTIPLLAYGCGTLEPLGQPAWICMASGMLAILLEVLLVVNDYYRRRLSRSVWVKKIGLEKAILIVLGVIAMLLSAMAVSSMDNPLYHKSDRLLIAFVFIPSQLVKHFGTFLGLCLQFFIMYLAGYLFFLINSRMLVSIILKKYGLIIYLCSLLTATAILYPPTAQLLSVLPIRHLLGPVFSSNAFASENAAGAIAILLLSLPILLSQQWMRQNSQIVSLEKEKTQAELHLLKQQLNPHFLFNTLNNLYSLSLQRSEKTPESILQLSELMRYVIYKGNEDKVPLGEELKYIRDFMDLQRMRLRQPLELSFNKENADPSLRIAPLLLIVFIENAFKHGIEPATGNAFLDISITTRDRLLIFHCLNSFEQQGDKQPGIGLSNLQKRLELLYPDKHLLSTEVKNHTFSAELQIDLS